MNSTPARSSLAILALALGFTASPVFALTADHRLGHEMIPAAESVRLTIDAREKTYSGSVAITVKAPAATDSFQLHAEGLAITRLALMRGRTAIATTFGLGDHGVLTVRTPAPIAPGAYSLEIEFNRAFDTQADGLYRVETAGIGYVFTQFEAASARRAFPCWDEPEYKIPWQLTIRVPAQHLVLSNTPIARDSAAGRERVVTFERTPPLSSYLIALAEGPFETVPIPGLGIPARVVTVKGQRALTAEVVKSTPAIMAGLERYFGSKYPFKKLDLIAAPEYWYGAMENPGAIVYNDQALLMDSKTATPEQRRRMIIDTAHEIAHMWFGDMVTMQWWDDLWLNESFAEWMGHKIADQVAPELEIPVVGLDRIQRAMLTDSRPSTRTIRQAVDANDNLIQLADFLAYNKGESVLGMIEQWIGPDRFRVGVRDYLAAHAWGNAVGADLWGALTKAAGRDMAGPITSFLNQPGVPVIDVESVGMGSVRLRQRRYLTVGDTTSSSSRWQIPVTLRYSDGAATRNQTVLLTEREQTVALETQGTLTWLYPNADERGYYHWSVTPGMMGTLSNLGGTSLTVRERVGYVYNIAALLDAGSIHGDDALRLLARSAQDHNPHVISAVIDALERARVALVTREMRGPFALYVRRTLQPALDAIGAERRPGEPEPVTSVRPRVIQWLGEYGEDPRVRARARALADSYLHAPGSVDPTVAGTMLELAAMDGDAMLWDAYRAQFDSAATSEERGRFIGALADFRDPAQFDRTLAYVLSGPLRPQEIRNLYRSISTVSEHQDRLFEWTRQHYDEIVARVPAFSVPFVVNACAGCSSERLEAGRTFFSEHASQIPGLQKQLNLMTDQVRACVRLRERESAAAARYLNTQAAVK